MRDSGPGWGKVGSAYKLAWGRGDRIRHTQPHLHSTLELEGEKKTIGEDGAHCDERRGPRDDDERLDERDGPEELEGDQGACCDRV